MMLIGMTCYLESGIDGIRVVVALGYTPVPGRRVVRDEVDGGYTCWWWY